jgi:hypothetical protein
MKTSTLPFHPLTVLNFYVYLHLENEVIVIINDKHIFKMKYSYCSKRFVRNCFNKKNCIKKIPRFKMFQKNKPSISYLIFSIWNMKVLNI